MGVTLKEYQKRNFKTQHRKGTGIKTIDQAILTAISTNTIDSLMIFTSTGKMYRLNVNNIPEGTNISNGTNIKTLLPFELNEEIEAVAALSRKRANNVVFFTKNGLIKKTKIEEYTSTKKKQVFKQLNLKKEIS